MKKISLFILTLFVVFGITGCKDDNEKVAKNVQLTISFIYPDGIQKENLTSMKVTVTNAQTSQTFSASENANGTYSATVPTGEYSILATGKFDSNMKALNGTASASVYADTQVEITLIESQSSSLIFKEIYYSKVKKEGKSPYFDEFFELYNNSDEVVYLDKIILARMEPSQGVLPSSWRENDGTGDLLKIVALQSYIAAFPGNGTDYPLQPGQSCVVATRAMNHHAECEESPVNLENADWEIYVGEYKATDTDNPDVPNMDILTCIGTAVNDFQVAYTGNALVICRLPEGTDLNAFVQDEKNLMVKPGQTANQTKFLIIPQEYVLDGVDIVNTNPDKRQKALRDEIDAGTVHNSADYNGKSIRRKVQAIVDGRVIYQDTNNSTEDFLTDQEPTPRYVPTTVD